ncbi:MAG: hypothetical protein BIFFINMI_01775 [Phycisphaerae bacterium]|nr:hypothetical protein [Phycisphaerae bacterium]
MSLLLLAGAVSQARAADPGPVQVWNCDRWQTVKAGDVCGVNPQMKSLAPIEMVGTRNAVCSGYVLVTRDNGPIKGLKASAGALAKSGDGRAEIIPADCVQVRFGELAAADKSWMPAYRFDRLVEQAPAEVAAFDPANSGVRGYQPKQATPVAMTTVWVTVRVPAGATPGDYAGSLAIEADGLVRLAAPVKLKVCDWQMPDPRDFRVRTMGWMSPEALAKHYDVPLWSDRHSDLMGQSMRWMLELGSRHVAIDVTVKYPARDNSDTMIKWVRQPDGSYTYDFTVFDKYCDLVAKVIGKPFPVRLNLWRGPRNGGGGESDDYPNSIVLMRDAATGEVSQLDGPHSLGSPEMKAFWKPVMDEIRTRLERRGWFDVAGPNWMCYCGGMTKELAGMVNSIWPGARWCDTTHGRVLRYNLPDTGAYAKVFVQSTVWNEGTLDAYQKWTSGPYPRQYAGRFDPSTAYCTHARTQYRETTDPSLWMLHVKHEEALLKGNDGLECLGADHFPGKPVKGRYRPGEWSAFAQGPNNGTLAILGAGDAGPVATERFEAMREGIQLCEAMVFIQKAIEAKKLPADLAARANKVLDDRAKALVAAWAAGPNKRSAVWVFTDYAKAAAARDADLYAMAAEVARQSAGK